MLEPRLWDTINRIGFYATVEERDDEDSEDTITICPECHAEITYPDEGAPRYNDNIPYEEFMRRVKHHWRHAIGHADDCPIKELNDFLIAYERLEVEETQTMIEPAPTPEPVSQAGWISGPADQVMMHAIGFIRKRFSKINDLRWADTAEAYAKAHGGTANRDLGAIVFGLADNGEPFTAQ